MAVDRRFGVGVFRGAVWWPVMMLLWLLGSCTDRDGDEDGDDAAAVAPEPASSPAQLAPVARVETTDAWQDLIAQRPSAVIVRDGRLVADLGRTEVEKHLALALHSPWKLGTEVGERKAGLVRGISASLDLPLDGDLAPAANPDSKEHAGLAMAISVKALAPQQSMTVLWEEQPLAHLRLGAGWERRTLSLPEDRVKAGDNRLRLHFRRTAVVDGEDVAAAVARVEVGTYEQIKSGPPPRIDQAPYRVSSREPGSVDLHVTPGTSLVFHVWPPRRARLRIDVRGRGSLEVLVSGDQDHEQGDPPAELLAEALRSTGAEYELDLSGWGERPIRLELRVRGSSKQAGAIFHDVEILARRSIPLDRRRRKPRDVIVLGVEGVRADELLHSKPADMYPNVRSFAKDALVFEQAHAVGAWAVPNHAAWLSSVPPPVHKTMRGTFVADRQVLLPEVLGRRGFTPRMVTANPDVNAERGLYQGFDIHERVRLGTESQGAVTVIERLKRAIIPAERSNLLAYAIVNDPQAPYDPPRETVKDVKLPEDAPLPHLTHIWVGRIRMKKSEPTETEIEYVKRMYRGELKVVDRALGDLMSSPKLGSSDDDIVVLLGLHGEEFLEHGSAGHGHSLYQESIHVPLMIRAPGLLKPDRTELPVDLLDLSPTLLDLLGMPMPDVWQGESLVPFIDDPQPPPRLLLAYLGDGSRAARVGPYKLILGPGNAQEFYDLSKDPDEAHNRVRDGGIALRIVRNALAWELRYADRWRRTRWGTGADLRSAFALDLGM